MALPAFVAWLQFCVCSCDSSRPSNLIRPLTSYSQLHSCSLNSAWLCDGNRAKTISPVGNCVPFASVFYRDLYLMSHTRNIQAHSLFECASFDFHSDMCALLLYRNGHGQYAKASCKTPTLVTGKKRHEPSASSDSPERCAPVSLLIAKKEIATTCNATRILSAELR